jgi:L-fucose isomerase
MELYFKAGGASVEFDAGPGPIAFASLVIWDDKTYMVMVKEESLDLSVEERKKINATNF